MTNQDKNNSSETPEPTLTPSELRSRASRQNGAKSRGPVTPEGKSRSSRNAAKHGFLARTVVLPNESHKRFTRLLKTIRAEFLPANDVENYLVECMAVARWRRLRAWSLERAIIGYEAKTRTPAFTDLAPSEHSAQTARALRHFSDDSRFLDNLCRHEVRCDRQYDRALKRLLDLRKHPQTAPESAL